MPSRRLSIATVFVLLAGAMALTRVHHFGAIPDASWAVFFVGGYLLRGQIRWAFPLLMALAVVVDYLVISRAGLDFWSHYCVSPGYWFLLPAHLSLWLAGSWLAARKSPLGLRALQFAAALCVGVVLCHLFAQGGFYWLSSSVAEPTVAGWWKNYTDWLWPYFRSTALYVLPLAVIEGLRLGLRQRDPADAVAR
ncbi:hypothetical protein [Pseudomarimonas salicorniae]|uniref:Uncharacterized protein n=1 Tax=Pseudomarimonas salicorniae TaxID=2933270 RepID=A0ABT0GK99_9GAMM|nr:hypothetical protein [Lysobacter sp. CAU 1642]MCK7594955.1 hypothetical protein [Lysobacter sp. CAU 1642]